MDAGLRYKKYQKYIELYVYRSIIILLSIVYIGIIMKKHKERIYYWQNIIATTAGIKRDAEDEVSATLFSKPIKIITGFRRSGKSFMIRQIARKYVDSGNYSLNNVLYLNFEDFKLTEVNSAEKLGELYDTFKTEIADKKLPSLLIFDEIQNIKEWDKFIRTIYESEQNVEIILTGSNSELLSSELGSNLAGRFIEFFLLPFSFKEFLTYRNIKPASEAEYQRNRYDIRTLFNEYISYGGLPEVFEINTPETKKSYLNGVLNKVVLDDIVKRFNVDNVDILEKILGYLLSSVGNIVSFAKVTNLIKSYGMVVSNETIIKYVSYFIRTFALFECARFDWKLNKFFPTTRKYYAIDPGLISLFRYENENYSFRMENVIFIELLRRKNKIHFGMNSNGKELDFITQKEKSNIDSKIQVCLELNTENLKREIKSFAMADKFLDRSPNLLLTLNEKRTFSENGIDVVQKNIIEWMLDI